MHLSMYLVCITGFSLGLLSVVQSQEGKPFFFIDFIDESFLPEPEIVKLEENSVPTGAHVRDKSTNTNEDKMKKDFSPSQKVSKTSQKVLKNEPSKAYKIPNIGDFLLDKTENYTLSNQTGNEFLFIDDLFSIFNDSQSQPKDVQEEKPGFTVPTAVTDISFESPDFGGVVPLHRMYLRAISSLVQYVMDTLFSFTETASSRFCESAIDYDMKPHRKIKKRDIAKLDSSDNNTDANSKDVVTSSVPSSAGKTGAPSDMSQSTPDESVSTEENNSTTGETTLTTHHSSPRLTGLTDTTVSKAQPSSVNVDVPTETKEHPVVTDGKESTLEAKETPPTDPTAGPDKSSGSAEEVTRHNVLKHKLHHFGDDSNMLADYIPVSFVNKKQNGVVEDKDIYDLQRTVRASFGQSSAADESNQPAEYFAVTVITLVVVAMLFGGGVVAFAMRKTFYNPSPAGAEQVANPLSSLA